MLVQVEKTGRLRNLGKRAAFYGNFNIHKRNAVIFRNEHIKTVIKSVLIQMRNRRFFCNAGIKAHRYMQNEEGYEMDFATNYLGNRLLTLLLLPLMPDTANLRQLVCM